VTPQEKASLAEQILSNPLFDAIMADMERIAIDLCINAPMINHELRAAAAAEVRAIRAFQANCRAALHNNRPPKDAPA